MDNENKSDELTEELKVDTQPKLSYNSKERWGEVDIDELFKGIVPGALLVCKKPDDDETEHHFTVVKDNGRIHLHSKQYDLMSDNRILDCKLSFTKQIEVIYIYWSDEDSIHTYYLDSVITPKGE